MADAAIEFFTDKTPVEGRVVRGEHVSRKAIDYRRCDLAECGLIAHHVRRNLREMRDVGRNRTLRIHQLRVHVHDGAAAHLRNGDLGDPIAVRGARPRRLHIDDGEAHIEQRAR